MLSISKDAAAMIRRRNQPIHLDLPPLVKGNCCSPNLQECPTVRYGEPRDLSKYEARQIDGITVYVPRAMKQEGDFTIKVTSFFGWKYVALDGWKVW